MRSRHLWSGLALAGWLVIWSVVVPAVAGSEHRVELDLWLDGVHQGEHQLDLKAGEPGELVHEPHGADSGWRLVFEIESPDPAEGAPSNALWVHVEIHHKQDGQWDMLADSLLGVVEGRPATLSVVEGPADDRGPDGSLVFLTLRTVSR